MKECYVFHLDQIHDYKSQDIVNVKNMPQMVVIIADTAKDAAKKVWDGLSIFIPPHYRDGYEFKMRKYEHDRDKHFNITQESKLDDLDAGKIIEITVDIDLWSKPFEFEGRLHPESYHDVWGIKVVKALCL